MEEAEEEGRSRCPELVFYLPSSAIFHIFATSMVRSSESAVYEIRSKAIPFWKRSLHNQYRLLKTDPRLRPGESANPQS